MEENPYKIDDPESHKKVIYMDLSSKKSFINKKTFHMENGYTGYTSPELGRVAYYSEEYLLDIDPDILEKIDMGGRQ